MAYTIKQGAVGLHSLRISSINLFSELSKYLVLIIYHINTLYFPYAVVATCISPLGPSFCNGRF